MPDADLVLEQVKNSPEEKEGNKAISSKRIFVEHLIRIIKKYQEWHNSG